MGGGATQGTTVGHLTFSNWGNTGPKQATIANRLDDIKENIDPDCNKWLLSNSTYKGIDEYIDILVDNNLIGYADVTAAEGVDNATTGSGVGGFAIVVNTGGSFFNPDAPRSNGVQYQQQIGRIVPGSARQGVFTLLHELAHSLSAGGFREDGKNQDAVNRNNDDVWKNYNRTIMGAQNRP